MRPLARSEELPMPKFLDNTIHGDDDNKEESAN